MGQPHSFGKGEWKVGWAAAGQCSSSTIKYRIAAMRSVETTVEDLKSSFLQHLRAKSTKLADKFDSRWRSDDPEKHHAALAEALTFTTLSAIGARPEVNEDIRSGGPDFRCSTGENARWAQFTGNPCCQFYVEATSFCPRAVMNRSTIPMEPPPGCTGGGSYLLLTQNVRQKIQAKYRQFEKCKKAVILSMVLDHWAGCILMDSYAAKRILVGNLFFMHRNGLPDANPNWYSALEDSAFLAMDENHLITAKNRVLSAILLIVVFGDHVKAFGILNPNPIHPLDISHLTNLPFLRLKHWPIENNQLETEWVLGETEGLNIPHSRINSRRA